MQVEILLGYLTLPQGSEPAWSTQVEILLGYLTILDILLQQNLHK